METIENKGFSALKSLIEVSKKIKNSELKQSKMNKVSIQLKEISKYLECGEKEAFIFTVIFALYVEQTHNLDTSDMARYISIDYMELLTYQKDLEMLIERGLITAKNNLKSSNIPYKSAHFSIDSGILQAIYSNEKIVFEKTKIEPNSIDFVNKVSNLIELRSMEEISTYNLLKEMESLENEFQELEMIKKLNDFNINDKDRLLFYEICDDFLEYGRTSIDTTLKNIFENSYEKLWYLRLLKNGETRLQELNFIKIEGGELFSDAILKLTDTGTELFLGEDSKLFTIKSDKKLINPDTLPHKQMFYGEELKKQIDFLTQSLMFSNHLKLQERLLSKSLPKGIADIFYGEPGTGKTETVYQIAKQTDREIMQVDISQSKSMWFGESEKRIKEVFTDYRRICSQKEIIPILLFNEADAIFSKRKDSTFSNVAQTENAIQNIILEEMERLDGILIATTNLNQNLDVAFERRFLFKIKFENPGIEIKSKIWRSKIPKLTTQEATELAERFLLSGGEIENIVRKIAMEEILTGAISSFEQILSYCDIEKFRKKEDRVRIGF